MVSNRLRNCAGWKRQITHAQFVNRAERFFLNDFLGRILHRNLTERGVCYGIVFVEETTRAFQENQQLLAQYIQERKKEILGLPVS